jgi:hypothetical protein
MQNTTTKILSFLSSFVVNTAAADTSVHGSMPAIDGGLEVAIALGSATSVGDVGDGMDSGELIGTAGQLELKLGSRLTPNLGLAFYSTAQALAEGSNRSRDVYTGSAGLMTDFHLRSRTAIDPWIGVGAGVAAILVEQDDGHSLTVGVELARLQLGIDFRLGDSFSIGPVIGASATLYGATKTPMTEFAELDDKGINWTFSAGVAGRFNAFGTRK